jgi:Ser/Thr protein kinase RdoA (MazF antagonist)
MRPYLEHRQADYKDICRFGDDLIAELRGLLDKDKPVYGICHGDLHTGNARLNQDGELVLYDFDSFGYGWRALDIGVYRVSYDWMDLSREMKAEKDRFWDTFLEGYSEVRSLGENELAAVALSLPIRHLELMGITMRYWAQHQGIHWITDAYFDMHVRWFHKWADEYRHY